MTLREETVSDAVLRAWLGVATPDVDLGTEPLHVERMSGGRSNLTYSIRGATGAWVLRQPPPSGVLQTAHDMDREWAFLTALTGTAVPVARPIARNRAGEVMAADCYLAEFVDGTVLHSAHEAGQLTTEARGRVGTSMVSVLAELHALDPDTVGLGPLRRPGRHIDRQLRRWHRQLHQSTLPDVRALDAVHERLLRALPDNPEEVICHGDFRPGNLSFHSSGDVAAVFDWELATLGDPLTDLGYLVATWARPGDPYPVVGGGPTVLDGFAECDDLVDEYVRLTGRDAGVLPFYTAFARWRSACIGAGVYTRYAAGDMGDDPDTEITLRTRLTLVGQLAEAAMADLDELDRRP